MCKCPQSSSPCCFCCAGFLKHQKRAGVSSCPSNWQLAHLAQRRKRDMWSQARAPGVFPSSTSGRKVKKLSHNSGVARKADTPPGQARPGLLTPEPAAQSPPAPKRKRGSGRACSAAPQPQGAWPPRFPAPCPFSPGPPNNGLERRKGVAPNPLSHHTNLAAACAAAKHLHFLVPGLVLRS